MILAPEARDISPDFRYSRTDEQTIKKILPYEATPEAIKLFARYEYRLSDYAYWFLLSTLWVSYTGWSDLEVWKRLFSSNRANRETSIMKPSELRVFRALPDRFSVFRAHRPEEKDWIAYTLSTDAVARFAVKRNVQQVTEYQASKADALCLFLRRGESEVLVLDKTKAEFVTHVPLIFIGDKNATAQ